MMKQEDATSLETMTAIDGAKAEVLFEVDSISTMIKKS